VRRVLQTTTEDGHFGPVRFGAANIALGPATQFLYVDERIRLHLSTPAWDIPNATVLMSAEEARELADQLLHMAKWAETVAADREA
jgi:hypothetical protein